jgi:hypothetical protein
LIRDWVRGSVVAGTTILSGVARTLESSKKGFEATLERLSRGLKNQTCTVTMATATYRRRALRTLKTMPGGVAAIDLSEIVKPYGRRMPFLCKVRDGSESRRKKPVLEKGWWTVEIGLSFPKHQVMPLSRRVFSTVHREFRSEQDELRRALEQAGLSRSTPAVLDSGMDGMSYFGVLDDFLDHWCVRQRGNRDLSLVGQDELVRASVLAKALRKDHEAHPWVVRKKQLVRTTLKFGYCTVELPAGSTWRRRKSKSPRRMTLIAVERPHIDDPSQPPMMLLCSRPVRDTAQARRWVLAYYRRWGSEEETRSAKQLGGLEDLRVLHWTRICNLVALSVLVEGLLALTQFEAPRRAARLARLAPIDGYVPAFVLYRIWLSVALLLQGRRLSR